MIKLNLNIKKQLNHSGFWILDTEHVVVPADGACDLNFILMVTPNMWGRLAIRGLEHGVVLLAEFGSAQGCVLGEISPLAAEGGFGVLLEHALHVLPPGLASDDLGGRVVYFPLQSCLNKIECTCFTLILSMKTERRKLKRRGNEILDYFLFLR
jgi:hypothetical protein